MTGEFVVAMFPGQGSQFVGMGESLWDRYPDWVRTADEVLGYSIRELCNERGGKRLNQTAFTQPALFVVNALNYQELLKEEPPPSCFIGHSLGEFNALHAAGAFDFAQGLRIVAKRADLMSRAPAGGMAVVIGMSLLDVRVMLLDEGIDDVDVGNHNSDEQVVLAGPPAALERLIRGARARGATAVPLNVSGAFHSRLMRTAAREFHQILKDVSFAPLRAEVISNHTAEPYPSGGIADLLALQIAHPVRWYDTIRGLRARGPVRFREIGPKQTLTRLLGRDPAGGPAHGAAGPGAAPRRDLGDPRFLARYGVRHALAAGSMYQGIASAALVQNMARAGFLSFFGSGGLPLEDVERALTDLRSSLPPAAPYGCNVLFTDDPAHEERLVDLLLRVGIRVIEASAYIRPTRALLRFKAAGLEAAGGDRPGQRRIIVKLSRADVAEAFLRPPAPELLDAMVRDGSIDRATAGELARRPVADDLTVEGDSGGHTDKGQLPNLLPAIVSLRDRLLEGVPEDRRVHVGAGGGIGTPWAALSALLLGADFVVTGSINQCTVEAGTSERVKDLLESLDVHDTAYAPAGDLFEFGAEVQVVKKGVFFPARARKLYELYVRHHSLDEIDRETLDLIERKYLGRSVGDVWRQVLERRSAKAGAADDPKAKMAAVFKWYFHQSTLFALRGDEKEKLNYQIHCGPALGAFNRWARGTDLQSWRQRTVVGISERLLSETNDLFRRVAS